MAALKHEVSIHIRLSDEADAMIELLAEAKETTRSRLPRNCCIGRSLVKGTQHSVIPAWD